MMCVFFQAMLKIYIAKETNILVALSDKWKCVQMKKLFSLSYFDYFAQFLYLKIFVLIFVFHWNFSLFKFELQSNVLIAD